MDPALAFLSGHYPDTLSLKAIYQGGEDKVYDTFKRLRWDETEGEPVLSSLWLPSGHKPVGVAMAVPLHWMCKQYSVTSGDH